jgi:class 3 adenylate cyclase
MLDLPNPILDYIYTLTFENRSPAYLFVEKTGRLSSWGGKLTVYGITNLQTGQFVGEQILFLEGLFPLDDYPIFLPCIKNESGRSVDVHIFPGNEGDWVLLLDATLEEIQRRLIQQQGNDLSLLRQQQSQILNLYLGKDIPETLGQGEINFCELGERRDVTILFAHICGLTTYSENNAAETVFKILNLYFTSIIQQIMDEAGLVDKIIGDVVTAFFGILPSSGCPRNQAVKAALRMIEVVKNIARIEQAENESKLNIRIGIASGPVALGILSSKLHRTFNAIGYYVNLAARLESQARPSEILIDENTFARIESMQKNFSPTNLLLQGMVEPLPIYSWLVQ